MVQDHLQRQTEIATGRHGEAHAANRGQPLQTRVGVGIQLRVLCGQARAVGYGLKPVEVFLRERRRRASLVESEAAHGRAPCPHRRDHHADVHPRRHGRWGLLREVGMHVSTQRVEEILAGETRQEQSLTGLDHPVGERHAAGLA